MNTITADHARSALDDAYVPEKIGLKCIKIKHGSAGCMAVVGTFFAADNLLGLWSRASTSDFECRFEITYVDECVIAGAQLIKISRRAPLRVSLTKHVRCAFEAIRANEAEQMQRRGGPIVWIAQPGRHGASHFLDEYDTDDFSARD